MADLIDRQAAIDAVTKHYRAHDNDLLEVIAYEIEQLPSAEKRTNKRTETHECDLISRQDAIRIVDSIDTWQAGWRDNAIESLKAMPSAQPERKTGHWIPQDHNHTHGNVSTLMYFSPVCSECGHTGDFNMNYCPSCGAKMDNRSTDDKVSDLPMEAYYNKNWKSKDGGGA